eukprot:4352065-Amphidinium_carterae.1
MKTQCAVICHGSDLCISATKQQTKQAATSQCNKGEMIFHELRPNPQRPIRMRLSFAVKSNNRQTNLTNAIKMSDLILRENEQHQQTDNTYLKATPTRR